MQNLYLDDYKYTEIIETLEDFSYDNYVKCAIPSICIYPPILDEKQQVQLLNNHICNSDIQSLGLMKKCNISNYIDIFIPRSYCDNDELNGGKKGTKFIVSFVGGNQNNFNICGRCYKC